MTKDQENSSNPRFLSLVRVNMAEVAELKEFVDEVDSDLSKIQREYSETVNNINVAFRQIDVIFSKHRQVLWIRL